MNSPLQIDSTCSDECDSEAFSIPGTPGIASHFIRQSQSPTNICSASCSLVFGSGIAERPLSSCAHNAETTANSAVPGHDRLLMFLRSLRGGWDSGRPAADPKRALVPEAGRAVGGAPGAARRPAVSGPGPP